VFLTDGELKPMDGFNGRIPIRQLRIPASVQTITDFSRCSGLEGLAFSPDGQLREIGRFNDCTSLKRVSVPASVQTIAGFCSLSLEFASDDDKREEDDERNVPSRLTELAFAPDGQLLELFGCNRCTV
jgi:hypothetical protein